MNPPDRIAWLKGRRAGIGGSDIAAILGMSPYTSAVDVWIDKTSQEEPTALHENEAMLWGNLLEDVVAQEASRRMGVRVQRIGRQIHSAARPWTFANLDRVILQEGRKARADKTGAVQGALGVLEVKTAAAHKLDDWGTVEDDAKPHNPDDALIPLHYQAQGMWYLGVTGLPTVRFACLLGGQRLVLRTLHANADLIKDMLEAAWAFWNRYVVTRTPPPATSGRDVLRLWKRDNGDMLEARSDPKLVDLIESLRDAKKERELADRFFESVADEAKVAIGPRSGLLLDGRPAVTFKATRDGSATDWEAVARAVCPDADVLAQECAKHVITTPGKRRFLVK